MQDLSYTNVDSLISEINTKLSPYNLSLSNLPEENDSEVTFELKIDRNLSLGNISISEDLGLENLPLNLEPSASVSANLKLQSSPLTPLTFTLTPDKLNVPNWSSSKLTTTLTLDVNEFKINGNIGFLPRFELTNTSKNSLTLDWELPLNGVNSSSPTISGGINLKGEVFLPEIDILPSLKIDLPNFAFDLGVNYEDGNLTTNFDNVNLIFEKSFLGQYSDYINQIIKPFKPFIDFLRQDIEFLTNLEVPNIKQNFLVQPIYESKI